MADSQPNSSRGNYRSGRSDDHNSYSGISGRSGGVGRFSFGGGGQNRQQLIPHGWGFGWYPLQPPQNMNREYCRAHPLTLLLGREQHKKPNDLFIPLWVCFCIGLLLISLH